jgi:ABC-type multidrug transport system ATPase subunit
VALRRCRAPDPHARPVFPKPYLSRPHARPSPPALELRGVHKSYRAGIPGCLARADVLRGADLRVLPGEVVGIAGGVGAGKSTLLLCAAGLLRADRGMVARFGGRGGKRAGEAAYLAESPELASALSRVAREGARLLLLDDALPALGDRAAHLVHSLSRRGLAIVLSAREPDHLVPLATRVLLLTDGRLRQLSVQSPRLARVAEGTRRMTADSADSADSGEWEVRRA